MNKKLLRSCVTLFMICAAAAMPQVAASQADPPSRVARLSYVNGQVSFQPAGVDEWVAANANRPLTIGDRLWTDRGARAELHLGNAAVRLSSQTGFSFLNLDDNSVQMQLNQGTIQIRLRELNENEAIEVDTPNLAFSLLRPGVYRLEVSPDGDTTTVTVRSGEGEATGGGQAYTIHPREQATFSGIDSLTFNTSNAPPPDNFDHWNRSRDEREDRPHPQRYVSRQMVGYEDLDDYGSWRVVSGYGPVWVPAGVGPGWAPYRYGHWAWIEPWGWTWVDDAPWGFAPFHYGRWAFVGNGWVWVPGPLVARPVYAPALVVFVGGSPFN